MRAVDRGQRPPVSVSDSQLRQLMERCWAHDPSARPTFDAVSSELAKAASDLTRLLFPKCLSKALGPPPLLVANAFTTFSSSCDQSPQLSSFSELGL